MDKTDINPRVIQVGVSSNAKQNKEFEMVSVNRAIYDKLIKLARYAQDWYPDYEECRNCGALHPRHTICVQCRYDNSTGKIRE